MTKRARIGVGIANLITAAIVAIGVFRGLPARWLPIDAGAVVVTALLAASGVTLLLDHRLAERLTRAAGFVTLACGLLLVAILAITASWLSGIYGTSGKGFAAIYAAVAVLVVPYLVIFPAALLAWVGPRARPS